MYEGLYVAADIAYLQASSVGGEEKRRDKNRGKKRRKQREERGGATDRYKTRTLQREREVAVMAEKRYCPCDISDIAER